MRKCIRSSKYNKRLFSSLVALTNRGISIVRDEISAIPVISEFLVVPIPISPAKLKQRGFNQAEILAKVAASKFGLKTRLNWLLRKDTPAQHKMRRRDRFTNLKDAFYINPRQKNNVENQRILLVDDTCTTGATLLESSRVLYAHGVKEVRCFTLSKSILKSRSIHFEDEFI